MLLALSWQAWVTLGVIAVMVVALAKELARPDLVLLGSLGLLLITQVIDPKTAFAGLSDDAVLTIASLFVVAAGVQKTDGLAFLDRFLFARTKNLTLALVRFMLPTAIISAFVNNTPLVAMLIPRVQAWAEREDLPVSKLMIPLSYATVMGGVITLLGTSTNLVVAGLMKQSTGLTMHLFDITYIGLPVALVGILYFAFIGHRLLPGKSGGQTVLQGKGRQYLFEVRVPANSKLAGRTVEEADLRALKTGYLSHIRRGEHVVGPVSPHEVLQEGDVLAFTGDPALMDRLLERPDLERVIDHPHLNGQVRLPLFEAVVSPTSTLAGKTLKESGFRERFQGVVLAIQRSDEQITTSLGKVRIKPGDLLLIEARPGFADRWNSAREEFYLVAARSPGKPGSRRKKAPIALGIFLSMVLLSAFNVIPLVVAAFAGALGMLLTRCLRVSEARQAVDIPVLLMIAAAFGIGGAIKQTGLAKWVAEGMVHEMSALGPIAVLFGVYVVTNFLTELLTNSAAAALMVPVAIAAAQASGMGDQPLPFGLAVAVAASAGFATPFGYQTNLMVMSAGGYRFMDYFRSGLPLNFVCAFVSVAAIWFFYM